MPRINNIKLKEWEVLLYVTTVARLLLLLKMSCILSLQTIENTYGHSLQYFCLLSTKIWQVSTKIWEVMKYFSVSKNKSGIQLIGIFLLIVQFVKNKNLSKASCANYFWLILTKFWLFWWHLCTPCLSLTTLVGNGKKEVTIVYYKIEYGLERAR